MPSTKHGLSMLHQFRYGVLTITNPLLQDRSDKSNSFCTVQLETSRKSFLCKCPNLFSTTKTQNQKRKCIVVSRTPLSLTIKYETDLMEKDFGHFTWKKMHDLGLTAGPLRKNGR